MKTNCNTPYSTFLLLLLLAGVFLLPSVSFAAPSQTQTAPIRPVPQAKAPAKTATQKIPGLAATVGQFDALLKDQVRNGRRDVWLDLEKAFSAIAAKGAATDRAKATLYAARSRLELSRRSFNGADYREAAKLFSTVASKYPKSPYAAESLHKQADILINRLNDVPGGRSILEKLIKTYPRYEKLAEAKKLLGTASRTTGTTAAQTAKPDKQASSVTLKNIRWAAKGQKAIITLELDGKTDFNHSFTPPDAEKKTPGKLYLDLERAMPAQGVQPGTTPKGLVVSRIRTGKTAAGTRVTLECDDAQCYLVSSPKGKPQTIQIEISRKQDIAGGITVAAAAKETPPKASSGKAGDKTDAVMKQLGLTVQTILIDAGHGGTDPGAQCSTLTEKHFTLAMAKRIGSLLQKEGFTVLYTRSRDKFISLQDRPDFANTKKADLFISVHVNANTKSSVRGLETYYLDAAKTQNAVTVAARENGVPAKNINDLQFILTDLMLSTKLKESRHLANCIHKGILQRLRGAKLAAHDNGVRSAPFYVLMGARMPAILVEFGYITNAEDLKNLRSDAFLQKQAEGVVRGVIQYKKELAQEIQKRR